MKKISIQQVEPRVAEELELPVKATLKKLGYSVPDNFRLRVSLLRSDGRKKRSSAGADTWAPEWPMQFRLEPPTAEDKTKFTTPAVTRASEPYTDQGTTAEPLLPAEAELLKALDRAEATPGWSFVSLKKFRDEVLPSANIPLIRTDIERQNLIRSAIEKRFILKKPIPNPKSPQFPVTSIRLNRLLPAVQEVLGPSENDSGFHPIVIKGEPLSATIMRERR